MPRIKKTEKIAKTEPLPVVETVDETDSESSGVSDTSAPIVIEKPKKQMSLKQKEAFEKARLKRQENIEFRKQEKEKKAAEYTKLIDEKKQKKELKIKKKQDLELRKIDTDSESSEEIVVVKKTKRAKKKIIYIDDEEEPKDNNIVIINKMDNPKPVKATRPKPMGVFC